jgi:hypothetical protein
MAAEYQEPDWRVVDYEVFCLDSQIRDASRDLPLRIRGPRPPSLAKGDYFVCLGAAQTFGRFCARPFPTILQERLSLSALNISHGGAGPSFFSRGGPRLLDYLNGARFVVIQVMSGRSEGNSLFESGGVGHYTRRSDGAQIGCDEAFEDLLRTAPRTVIARIVEETRRNWLGSYRTILDKVTVPTVLFWFSTRRPRYRPTFDSLNGLFNAFPQLVNKGMVRSLRAKCEYFASCVSRRGLPQKLVDRWTGEAVTIRDPWTASAWDSNWYYPSPEMHSDAANALEAPCRSAAGLARRKLGRASQSTGAPGFALTSPQGGPRACDT